jgi:hypothetical protein
LIFGRNEAFLYAYKTLNPNDGALLFIDIDGNLKWQSTFPGGVDINKIQL